MRDSEEDLPDAAKSKEASAAPGGEAPGLPGLRTWRGVYLVVLASFVLYVILLAVFSRAFS